MKIFLAAVLTFVSVCACSLEEDMLPFVNQETYYKNEAQCRSVVNSCYIEIHSIYTSDMSLLTETCTDLMYNTNTTVDAHLEVTPSKPQYGATVWKRAYRGVNLCNDAIACIDATPYIDKTLKQELTAECRVMRAMYYYILTNTFDGVPYYTCQVNTHAVQDSIRFLERTPADTIRLRLYKDLRDNALPYFERSPKLKVKAKLAPGGRSGYAHALMLMAKFAMWYKDWDGALEPLRALEELYGKYSPADDDQFGKDYPIDNIKWSYKGKEKNEVIYEIQHEYDITGIKKYSNLAMIMMPPRVASVVGKDTILLWDGVNFGETYGKSMPGRSVTRVNPMFASYRMNGNSPGTNLTQASLNCVFGKDNFPIEVDPDTLSGRAEARGIRQITDPEKLKNKDRRARLNFAMGNWETGQVGEYLFKDGYFYVGEKFWCPDILLTYDSNNYKLFRYADALLMMAECWYHKGDDQKARDYIDVVRIRAGLPRMELLTGQDLMDAIVVERAKELFGEYHRKWDLVRWGIWYDRTKTYNAYSKLKEHMRPCHEYYPIPDAQCALSGYKLDNPAYKNDGLN